MIGNAVNWEVIFNHALKKKGNKRWKGTIPEVSNHLMKKEAARKTIKAMEK